MATGRHVRKSISCSERQAALKTDGARLLYVWLLTHLDVNGNFWGNPELVKSQVMPLLKKNTKIIQSYIDDLEKQKLLIKYKVSGKNYIHYPDFRQKQVRLEGEKTELPLFTEKNKTSSDYLIITNDIPPTFPDGNPTETRRKPDLNLIECNLIESNLNEVKKGKEYNSYKDIWNGMVDDIKSKNSDCKITKCFKMNNARKRALAARLKEPEFDFPAIITKIKQSNFLQGLEYSADRSPFSLTIDWVLDGNKYPRILEGKYDNRNKKSVVSSEWMPKEIGEK